MHLALIALAAILLSFFFIGIIIQTRIGGFFKKACVNSGSKKF